MCIPRPTLFHSVLSLAGAYAAFDSGEDEGKPSLSGAFFVLLTSGDSRQLICARWPATGEYMYLWYDCQFLSLSLPRTAVQLGGKNEYA